MKFYWREKTLYVPGGNSRGQFVIEAILILVVFLGLVTLVTDRFKSKNLVQQLVGKPWGRMAGMIESGVWEPAVEARKFHPSQTARSRTHDNHERPKPK